jgi:dihydrofolate reductase
MGRKTYDVMQAMSNDDPGMNPAMKTYVFSRKRKARTEKGVEFVTGNAIAFVRKLKAQRGKEICCMGGGEFAQSLFEAGLIDEVGVNIHPVLLGTGVALFLPLKHQVGLELTECRPLPHGCVSLTYKVKPPVRAGVPAKRRTTRGKKPSKARRA